MGYNNWIISKKNNSFKKETNDWGNLKKIKRKLIR